MGLIVETVQAARTLQRYSIGARRETHLRAYGSLPLKVLLQSAQSGQMKQEIWPKRTHVALVPRRLPPERLCLFDREHDR